MSATDGQKPIPGNGVLPHAKVELEDAFTTEEFDDDEEFDLTSASAGFRNQLEQGHAVIEVTEAETDGGYKEQVKDTKDLKSPVWSPNFVLRRTANVDKNDASVVATPPVSPFAVVEEEQGIPSDISLSRHKSESSKGSAHEVDSVHGNEQHGSVSASPSSDPEHGHSPNHDNSQPPDYQEDEDVPVQSFEDVSLEEEEPPQLSARTTTPPHSGTPMHSNQQSQVNSPGGQVIEFNLPAKPSSTMGSPVAPTSFQTKFKPTRDRGGSALEKVISKTRPVYLPPKPKAEDRKHLRDWEEMMKKSREAGKLSSILPSYKS